MVERVGPNKPAALPEKTRRGVGKTPSRALTSPVDFPQIFEEAKQSKKVTFSAHALNRLEQRKIKFCREDLQKIAEAMEKVAAKGARSPLLLYNDIALLASIPNRTIITAVDGKMEEEQIYTHIDSAVILK
ncbi:MAG: hypothetical protein GX878_01815 [Firmicutes bacterium]|nr:hypothetical protein [Bacillota bacterium]